MEDRLNPRTIPHSYPRSTRIAMSDDQNSQSDWRPPWFSGSGGPPWGTGTPPWGTGPPPWLNGQATVTQVVTQTQSADIVTPSTTVSDEGSTQITAITSGSEAVITVTPNSAANDGSSDTTNHVPIIVGSVIGAIGFLSLLLAGTFLYLRHRKEKAKRTQRTQDPLVADENQTNATVASQAPPTRNISIFRRTRTQEVTPFGIFQPASVHIQKLPLAAAAEKGSYVDSETATSSVTVSSRERNDWRPGLPQRNTDARTPFFNDGPPPEYSLN
ncbi:hypothetical protein WG66_006673 [Moniliophthora roreri]|nr:hypothetical protein WG66_006673 [Moniliophthora roreri]